MEFHQNLRRPVALSRSVVITEQSSIPSLLLLGKLVSDGGPDSASLQAKLRQTWCPSGMVNFWRVTDGALLIQFYEAEDLTRVLDGAPWSCDGDNLFLVQHLKPGMNMVDQIAGFTKAELWVQFHLVPEDHCNPTSIYALAARIGEPVNCELGANSIEFLRARIRVDITRPLQPLVDVELENGKEAWVSVVYEGIPSLCGSCRILGHPADRCRRANQAAAAAAYRSEKPPVYIPSRLGSRQSTSRAPSSPLTEKNSPRQEANAPVLETALAPPAPRSGQGRHFSVKGSCSNFFEIICLKTSTKKVGKIKHSSSGDNLQDQDQALQINSVHESVQEPSIIETKVPHLDTTLITYSHFTVKAQGSRSRKHARIEVMLETQCSPQLIMGSMQWLSQKGKGLCAEYDGKCGIISIFALQIDHNTDPVDLIIYLFPKFRTNADTDEKHESPARFADTKMCFHDENCCEVTLKDSQKEKKDPSIMEAEDTQLDNTLITHSHFIVKAKGSRSMKHARIDVMMKTQCSPQLIMGAMDWLSQKAEGLCAEYDGQKGIISIFGLQIDQNTDPVDIVACLFPKIGPKTELAETNKKPDSPARFADTMMRFHDANCCKVTLKDSQKVKKVTFKGTSKDGV
ncbi:hypothetical protein VPH35_017347 [Triticum aestivum]|uniref:uncharacterized protein isoform X2 n=1 Tax=Triticum aestivum TaxID=4565 RepID=UPI001D022BF5|nr:uncharacterized protein LOC123177812 isoform X2 [Triticum aestivum]